MRVAAVQLDADLGEIETNLRRCAQLIDHAVDQGAELVALPEFFATGVAWDRRLTLGAPTPDGAPTRLLRQAGRRHQIFVGGSILVRDDDGEVRNAYLLAGPDGELRGRHDKDLPTGWENALYVGGDDDGRIDAGRVGDRELTVGAAVCWEFMRTGTARRLAGKVDLVLGGSGWWSVPGWHPRPVFGPWETANAKRAVRAPQAFARYVGAPVVHAAHSGPVSCPMPLTGLRYRGYFEGGASITDAAGRVLAARSRADGPGVVIADVEPGRSVPAPLPNRYWLQSRGLIGTVMWEYQNRHGRVDYARSQRKFRRHASAS